MGFNRKGYYKLGVVLCSEVRATFICYLDSQSFYIYSCALQLVESVLGNAYLIEPDFQLINKHQFGNLFKFISDMAQIQNLQRNNLSQDQPDHNNTLFESQYPHKTQKVSQFRIENKIEINKIGNIKIAIDQTQLKIKDYNKINPGMIVGKLTRKIIQKMAELKPQSKRIQQMAEKIQIMNETMNKTSPKIFSILMILSTLPSFYFGYKMITTQYKDNDFTVAANAGLSYINIKNVIFYGCLTALTKLKFSSPTAKNTIPKMGLFGAILPPLTALITLCLPTSDSKYIVIPTFISDVLMLTVELQASSYGTYPFWLYSYRHYARFFDWLIIISTFFALRNLQKRVKSHPHQFVKQIQDTDIQQQKK